MKIPDDHALTTRKYAPPVNGDDLFDDVNLDHLDECPIGKEIEQLPHGLGAIQDYIYNRMIYPSRSNAGVAAISFVQAMSSGVFKANIGQGDLALNEMFMVIAPTGFGKEDLRKAIRHLIADTTAKLNPTLKPRVLSSLPASMQGLHDLVVESNGLAYFMADEFGEWLADTKREGHKQQCVGYLMQAYTSPFSTLSVPYSVARSNKVNDVENPRISVFATSTWARMGDVMSASQANSGSYNRFVIHMGEQHQIAKRYDVPAQAPDSGIVSLMNWVGHQQGNTLIQFDAECRAYYRQYDTEVIEPLKFKDSALAGRLSEQAIRLAATIAITDKRLVVCRADLETAYAIRLGMYHRISMAVKHDGLLGDEQPDAIAYNDLVRAFQRHEKLARSKLVNFSRTYKRLSIPQMAAVGRMLETNGICCEDPERKGRLLSMVYQGVTL